MSESLFLFKVTGGGLLRPQYHLVVEQDRFSALGWVNARARQRVRFVGSQAAAEDPGENVRWARELMEADERKA